LKETIKHYLQGLASLFYPRLCAVCGNALYLNEEVLCLKCYAGLPRTGFHTDPENEVARLFWGRIPVSLATAFIIFNKESQYSGILHELKYKGQQQIGIEMGRLFGLELRESPFARVDLIHPVPLHSSKLQKRGYNQSELIARGLSEALQIPMMQGLVIRNTETGTQTRKSRYERWENVRGTFQVVHPEPMINKHVLLVDDVITTGATVEACAGTLLSVSGVSVSIASLAFTRLH